ncbi:MAG: hypothetical protein K6F35_06610 [Lachnospiraceae bacterium]|nr:hypothetical protein [Lachnospiraceae bacterium]
MQLARISEKFEKNLKDTKELEHLLDLNEVLNVYWENDGGVVFIQLAHASGTGRVTSSSPIEFDLEYNHVAQVIYDRTFQCLTLEDDIYDNDERMSVKELIQFLRKELKG